MVAQQDPEILVRVKLSCRHKLGRFITVRLEDSDFSSQVAPLDLLNQLSQI